MVLGRWENYLLAQGKDFSPFWEDLLLERERNLLFILGLGFDPRMCEGLKVILNVGGSGRRDCLLIEYDLDSESSSCNYADLVEKNQKVLEELLSHQSNIKQLKLETFSRDGKRRRTSHSASNLFDSLEDIKGFTEITDIIIDISAIPRSIYLSIIAKLLHLIDRENGKNYSIPNLHIIVSENTSLDRNIRQQGISSEATNLHGFSGDLSLEATKNTPRLWLPILGEERETEIRRIYEYLDRPNEICPVLPSPALNPRRGDSLILLEYRELFFDEFRVEPRDIIYASEQNPFEAYRQIYKTIVQYNKTLSALGGCKAFISPVSSKLLSIGALLAAYEIKQSDELKRAGCRAGITYVESHGYQIFDASIDGNQSELFSLWLAGECYEP